MVVLQIRPLWKNVSLTLLLQTLVLFGLQLMTGFLLDSLSHLIVLSRVLVMIALSSPNLHVLPRRWQNVHPRPRTIAIIHLQAASLVLLVLLQANEAGLTALHLLLVTSRAHTGCVLPAARLLVLTLATTVLRLMAGIVSILVLHTVLTQTGMSAVRT